MKYLYKNKYWAVNKEYNLDKLLYLMVDRPNKIIYNNFSWINNKEQWHRDYDLPSNIFFHSYEKSINLHWHNNNSRIHREKNKPAIIWHDGYKSYYINGKWQK